MAHQATAALDGPHGNFRTGDLIFGVPDDVVSSWVDAGVAIEVEDPPAEVETADAPAPEQPEPTPAEDATNPGPETATAPAQRSQRRTTPKKG